MFELTQSALTVQRRAFQANGNRIRFTRHNKNIRRKLQLRQE